TNAATILQDGFKDTEELGGLFSGYHGNRKTGIYDAREGRWGYVGTPAPEEREEWGGATPMYQMLRGGLGMEGHSMERGAPCHSGPRHELMTMQGRRPATDPTLQDPRCVFQIL